MVIKCQRHCKSAAERAHVQEFPGTGIGVTFRSFPWGRPQQPGIAQNPYLITTSYLNYYIDGTAKSVAC
jgi:hypothetical protein